MHEIYAEFNLGLKQKVFGSPELGTLEWWMSRSMVDPLFFLISRLALNICIGALFLKYVKS